MRDETGSDHSTLLGYVCWVFGFIGLHRFYFGKPLTGAIWALTLGLFFIGWLFDLFFIPDMAEDARQHWPAGPTDYNLIWVLLVFLGVFGIHRFMLGKTVSGIIYLLTLGVFGLGIIYDLFTLNTQIAEQNSANT